MQFNYKIVFLIIGILFFAYGIYLRFAKNNSILAIKNKYTKKDEIIFKYTNKFCSVIFMFCGAFICIASIVLQNIIHLTITTAVVFVISLICVSYVSRTIYNKFITMYKGE